MAKPRDLANSVNPGGIPASSVTSASISAAGVVQLNNAVNSTSTTTAATANAVKTANDNALGAAATANAAMPKAGGTFTGAVTVTGTARFDSDASLSSLNGDCLAGLRNRIINGGMRVCQRSTSTVLSAGNAAGVYTLDRWRAINDTDGTFTVSQSSDVPSAAGFTNSLLVTINTADAALAATQRASIQQRIEGYRVADFAFGTAAAKTVWLSFWVKSSVTGIYGFSIRNAGSGATRSYNFYYQISTANTWEKKTLSISGDLTGTWGTSNGVGMNLTWSLGCGTSARGTDFWSAADTDGSSSITAFPIQTASATWQLTGVQLESGTVSQSSATPFERRPMALEMALCQRYFYKTYNHENAPGTATTVGQVVGIATSGGSMRITVPFKVTLRDTPSTVIVYSPVTGGSGVYRDDTGAVERTSSLVSVGAESASISGSTSASALVRFHIAAEAEL